MATSPATNDQHTSDAGQDNMVIPERRDLHFLPPKERIHDWHRAVEFAHLGWENTWTKFDRLFLSGMEPTHPDHVAYDGRFDAESVY